MHRSFIRNPISSAGERIKLSDSLYYHRRGYLHPNCLTAPSDRLHPNCTGRTIYPEQLKSCHHRSYRASHLSHFSSNTRAPFPTRLAHRRQTLILSKRLSDRNPLTIRTSIFNTAVVYSLRDWPAWGLESSFTALSNSSTQPLLIHGTTDNTVPYKYTSKILTFLSHSHLLTVDGAGHDIIVTYTTQVSVVLVQSLSMKGHMNGAANTYLYNISLPPDDGWTPVPPYP
ncbi:hypothetical protein BKA82DRAFT_2243556 [Pisolithus tinctorius]|nr:hypothetical protein BKA82DRAFT_2243556 [Pisolithus tinctorius]